MRIRIDKATPNDINTYRKVIKPVILFNSVTQFSFDCLRFLYTNSCKGLLNSFCKFFNTGNAKHKG